MPQKKEKHPRRKRRVKIFRLLMQYVFIFWPTLRNSVLLWFQYKPKKEKKKKEKIVIIK
jgi:hypothetical protein